MEALSLFAEGNLLRFPNKAEIVLPGKPITIQLLDSVLVVVWEVPVGSSGNDNVSAYSLNGGLLWQLDTKASQLFNAVGDCPFTGAGSTADESGIILYNWCDAAFLVNHLTGELLEKYQAK